MAKQRTECQACGGAFDGTPSGLAKHVATGKHTTQVAAMGGNVEINLDGTMNSTDPMPKRVYDITPEGALVAEQFDDPFAQAAFDPEHPGEGGAPTLPDNVVPMATARAAQGEDFAAALSDEVRKAVDPSLSPSEFQAAVKARLARRKASLQWRLKNRPDAAEAYRLAHVLPFEEALALAATRLASKD